MCIRSRAYGIALIELIMFIVIVGVALAGVLLVLNVTAKSSADPLVHKQALALAESLLEEIELMPFTYCDPDDPNAASAFSAADCTGGVGGANDESRLPLGPEAGETRYSLTTPFDNVSDYNGFGMADGAILDVAGGNVGLAGYSAAVTVVPVALAGFAAGDALQITVTVTGPDKVAIAVDGIRTRYAPRALP